MSQDLPLSFSIDFESGGLGPSSIEVIRHLSDMRGLYQDDHAEAALIAHSDPIVYRFFEFARSTAAGDLRLSVTVIEAGKVGAEFFMTKGHYHTLRDRAEIYYG